MLSSARWRHGSKVACIAALHKGRLYLAVEGPRDDIDAAWKQIGATFGHVVLSVLWRGEAAVRSLPHAPLMFLSGDPAAERMLSQPLDRASATDGPGEASRIFEALAHAAEQLRLRALPAPADGGGGCLPLVPASPTMNEGRSPNRAAESEGLIEALASTFGTAILSADQTFLRTNDYFATLFGYASGELEGRLYASTLCVTDDDHLGRLWRAVRQGEIVRVDRRGLRRDGREIWLRSTYRPRRDPAGRLLDVTEFSIEITQEKLRQLDERGQINAINRSQAVIHFTLDGTITDANALFFSIMGYGREEVIGGHHRMFVDPAEAASPDYATFWQSLAAGRFRAAEFRRIAKGGRPVWLQATYNPILDMAGRPFKIVKYAVDVTAEKLQRADSEWQIAAIHKSNAVITFDMGGIILDANDNFLTAFGYSRDEVLGHHHRMFVEESFSHGAEYAEFWRLLGQGLHQSGQYTRIDRLGRKMWLQATYNPIFDIDGKPFKIVKYATIVTHEKLRQAEHQGQIAAIHKAQAVASFGLDGTILDANRKLLDILGYRLADVRGCSHDVLVWPESMGDQSFWSDLAAGQNKSGEFKYRSSDGREVWLQTNYNSIFDMDGRPFKIVQYAIDVTAQKLRQAAIDGQLAAIHRSQGVLFMELDGTILDVNDTLLATLGYGRDELIGQPYDLLLKPEVAASPDHAAFWETLSGGGFVANRFRLVGKGGREVWLQATYNPILDLDERPYRIVSLSTDVTADVAMADAYRDAERQAHHDAATTLPNRVRLLAHMAAALTDPHRRLVVLYLDLDRFKPVNDTFGHPVGDRVLREVADRMRRSLAPDQLAARVGGDEFVVVAADLSDEAIEALCQRLIDAVSTPIAHESGSLAVGVSVGVAVAHEDGSTPEDLLRAADAALYRSKQRGRGGFSFHAASMNERVLAHHARSEHDIGALVASARHPVAPTAAPIAALA